MPEPQAIEAVARELHDAVFAFNRQTRPWDSLNTAEREWFMARARRLLERVENPRAN